MPATTVLLVAGAAVLVGALVQGTVGFGLAAVAAPAIAFVDAGLLPGTMLPLAVLLPVLTLRGEWREVDWRSLGWAFLGRAPGTVVGVYLVARLPERGLAVLVGVVVLLAVGLTATRLHVEPQRSTLLAGGFVSGITGTATSIGGPPMALVLQRMGGPQLRATLAVYFLVGGATSLAAVAAVGAVTGRQLLLALLLVPPMVVGFAFAGPLGRRVDKGRTRAAVLVVAGAAAVALLVHSLG